MTKTKIALAAVLFAATSSAAFAQGYDPNLSNRYPGMATPGNYGYSASGQLGSLQSGNVQSAQVRLQKHGKTFLQSAPVRLQQSAPVLQQRDVALPGTGEGYYDGDQEFNADRFDHASSPFAGGGGL
jgi:hypothetical protein